MGKRITVLLLIFAGLFWWASQAEKKTVEVSEKPTTVIEVSETDKSNDKKSEKKSGKNTIIIKKEGTTTKVETPTEKTKTTPVKSTKNIDADADIDTVVVKTEGTDSLWGKIKGFFTRNKTDIDSPDINGNKVAIQDVEKQVIAIKKAEKEEAEKVLAAKAAEKVALDKKAQEDKIAAKKAKQDAIIKQAKADRLAMEKANANKKAAQIAAKKAVLEQAKVKQLADQKAEEAKILATEKAKEEALAKKQKEESQRLVRKTEVTPEDLKAKTTVTNSQKIKVTKPVIIPKVKKPILAKNQSNVRVYLYEYQVDFSSKTIPTGTVNFEIINNGKFTHEFNIKGVKDFGRIPPKTVVNKSVGLFPGSYEVYSDYRKDYERGLTDYIKVTE